MNDRKTYDELKAALAGAPPISGMWRHRATGGIYYPTQKVMLKVNGEWVVGVQYRPRETYVPFARTLDDFLAKFERVE